MREPIYFLSLELENVRSFKKKVLLDLSDGNGNWRRWTVILGNNGTGKTTLLQLLASFQIEKFQSSQNGSIYCPIGLPGNDNLDSEIEVDGYCKAELNKVSTNFGSYTKYLELRFLRNENVLVDVRHDESLQELKCFGYGANRFMSINSSIDKKNANSETLFSDNERLINAEEWLLQLDYAASKESEIKEFAINKRKQVKQTLIDLLPDVAQIRFTSPTRENLKSTVEFETPYGWVTIHQLSLGYKTMVAWMVDLAARMFERYPDSDNPLAESAIVLVDEIDLHMHPKWQRKIFDYLSEKFPKTQFIVTAHSPLIVQSAPKDANIVLLRRESDHVVIDNDIKSVRNWRLDQILSSDLFNDSAWNPEINKWLDERKLLLQKDGELTEPEKQRLKELNEKAYNLRTAESKEDNEAMDIIRKAAEYLKGQTQTA